MRNISKLFVDIDNDWLKARFQPVGVLMTNDAPSVCLTGVSEILHHTEQHVSACVTKAKTHLTQTGFRNALQFREFSNSKVFILFKYILKTNIGPELITRFLEWIGLPWLGHNLHSINLLNSRVGTDNKLMKPIFC